MTYRNRYELEDLLGEYDRLKRQKQALEAVFDLTTSPPFKDGLANQINTINNQIGFLVRELEVEGLGHLT